MRFQTPQFIEVEDKIFGPLTLKQFIYLAGSAGASFLFYRLLPLSLAVLFIAPIALLGVALAFLKVNNKPFINVLEAAFRYAMGKKLYIWKREPKETADKKASDTAIPDALTVPTLSESKLKDLAWSLDVHDVHEMRQHQNSE